MQVQCSVTVPPLASSLPSNYSEIQGFLRTMEGSDNTHRQYKGPSRGTKKNEWCCSNHWDVMVLSWGGIFYFILSNCIRPCFFSVHIQSFIPSNIIYHRPNTTFHNNLSIPLWAFILMISCYGESLTWSLQNLYFFWLWGMLGQFFWVWRYLVYENQWGRCLDVNKTLPVLLVRCLLIKWHGFHMLWNWL